MQRVDHAMVHDLRKRFINRLDKMDKIIFSSIRPFHDKVTTVWEERAKVIARWDDDVTATLSALTDEGFVREACLLSQDLFSDDRLTDTTFKHQWPVSGGRQTVTLAVTHLDAYSSTAQDGPQRSLSQQGLVAGQTTAPDITKFLSQAPLVALNIDPGQLPHTDLSQAQQHISLAPCFAFCVFCSCTRILVANFYTSPGEPTHDLVPRYLPMNHASDHFREIHQETFADGNELVLKHGREGTCDPPGQGLIVLITSDVLQLGASFSANGTSHPTTHRQDTSIDMRIRSGQAWSRIIAPWWQSGTTHPSATQSERVHCLKQAIGSSGRGLMVK